MFKSASFVAGVAFGVLLLGVAWTALAAGEASYPNTFVSGTPARADQVNANFAALAGQITANVPRRTRLDYSTKATLNAPTSNEWVKLRELGSFTKHTASTDLVIDWSGDVWVNAVGSETSARFQLRLDDQAHSAGAGEAMFHPQRTSSGVEEEHLSIHVVFEGVTSGVHSLSLWVNPWAVLAVQENTYEGLRSVYVEESPSR